MTARRLWEVLGPAGTLGFAFAPDEPAAVAKIEGATAAAEIVARPASDAEAERWKAHELEPVPLEIAMGYGALIPPDPARPTWVCSDIEGPWLVHGPKDAPFGVCLEP